MMTPAAVADRRRPADDKDMCAESLAILNRTVMVPTHPEHDQDEIDAIINNIGVAARTALGDTSADAAEIRRTTELDMKKFDAAS